jgi:hypothetical protein
MRTVARRASKLLAFADLEEASQALAGITGTGCSGMTAVSSWPLGLGRLPPPRATGRGFGAPCTGSRPCWPSGDQQLDEEVLEVCCLLRWRPRDGGRAAEEDLGSELPLERTDQAAWGVLGHALQPSAVMRRPSVMRPHELGLDLQMTSVCAGHQGWGGGEGI